MNNSPNQRKPKIQACNLILQAQILRINVMHTAVHLSCNLCLDARVHTHNRCYFAYAPFTRHFSDDACISIYGILSAAKIYQRMWKTERKKILQAHTHIHTRTI